MDKNFSPQLLSWYMKNKRTLPWRGQFDPYVVWLSEIILQQTRIEQGTPYFLTFLDEFPTITQFAKAKEDRILKLWQGLGYYSRARNMHATAQEIVTTYHGKFPDNYEQLIKLKGIGDYTACIILSICFNKPYAVVDGNVYRVLSRFYGIEEFIDSTIGAKLFKQKAQEVLDHNHPGDFNQALMDFGSMVCTPTNPSCTSCLFRKKCKALKEEKVEQLPRKQQKLTLKKRYLHYFLITDGKNIAIQKRSSKDIWQGLYELPLIEQEKINQSVVNEELKMKNEKYIKQYSTRHLLSHQELLIVFYKIKIKSLPKFMSAVAVKELERYAFPKPIAEFINSSM